MNFLSTFWRLISARFEAFAQSKEQQTEPVSIQVQTRQHAMASERLDMNLSNIYEVLISFYIRLMKLNYVGGWPSG